MEVSGDISFENAMLRRDLIARDLKINGYLNLHNCIYNKDITDLAGIDSQKIVY